MISLILACAGKGERAGMNKNKLLVTTDGLTVAEKTFLAFKNTGLIDEYIVVASEGDFPSFNKIFNGKAEIVVGGNTRFLSVRNALERVTGDVVLIHDGARPFVNEKIIKNCIESVNEFGSGITAVKSVDTVAVENNGFIVDELKKNAFTVQTPQGFKTEEIKKAFSLATRTDYPDDASVYAEFIAKPHLSEGDENNVKLTFKKDFSALKTVRVGEGFDCHRLEKGRKLILGGVEIPHEKGLLGHSDADVLTHAVMDAVLSALSLRDIGYHFPDSDQKYKDADSMLLLTEVLAMAEEKGYAVSQVSAVIMAEKPKLSEYIPQITENLAKTLGVPADCVGIGATTLEGLGLVGSEEGICVHAPVTLT
ncbi:MAG: 2-C-methyl-D-erythritol 2,4-cyclodiphosphate synthase, partial [Clostridia bacterium]|nr:2-C-methyl-D-erythritol 2,4-cyclodiphosphate synthase [Clostridia bacterium]